MEINSTLTSLNLYRILIFLSVVETKSFSETADTMFLTQSAVSKSISRLEKMLGVPLFTRSARNVIPTTYAEMLYPVWKASVADLNTSFEEVLSLYQQNIITLHVSVPTTSNPYMYIWPRTQQFLSENKDVKLSLTNEFFKEQLEHTLQGVFDISFLPHFDIKTLEEYHFCWAYAAKTYADAIVPVSHRLAEKEYLVMEDLLDEKMVTFDSSVTPNHKAWLDELWGSYGKKCKIGFKSTEPLIIHNQFESSDHILLSDHFFIFPESDNIRRIPIRDVGNGIVVAWHPSLKKPAALKYIEYMKI